MSTIDDVAQRAGVSPATVSRALRGFSNVSDAARERVFKAADELSYSPSPNASRLAGGKTSTIGILVPWINRWYFSSVIKAAELVFRDAGYDVLLYSLGGREPSKWGGLDRGNLSNRIDALMTLWLPDNPHKFFSEKGFDLPIVSVGGFEGPWPIVRIDDVQAAKAATEYLIRLGHRKIAHLSGDRNDELAYTVPTDRITGYREALEAAGIPYDPTLEVMADFTVKGGERAMDELLERGVVPTAVFAACDETAMGAMIAMRRKGIDIPNDLSIIGIDDHEMAEFAGLTTIRQPVSLQGQLAAGILLDQLSGKAPQPPQEVSKVIVPTELVVRESARNPSGEDLEL